MRYTGTFTEIDEDLAPGEYDDDLAEVVVSKDTIAFDWVEDDEHFSTTLYPKGSDTNEYFGDMTMREDPAAKGYISAYRYDLKGGDILILARWRLDDSRGVCLFELTRD